MNDKIKEYINGKEEVRSEKVVEDTQNLSISKINKKKEKELDYYTEKYDNHSKREKERLQLF